MAFPTGDVDLLLTSDTGATKLYAGGSLIYSSASASAAGSGAGGTPTRFGMQFDPFAENLLGSIDSIRIYDSVILPGDVVEPVSGVPEPANWAMLVAGFGLAGTALRHRRRVRPA